MASEAIALTIVSAGTGLAAVIDLRTRHIPNALTGALAVIGVGIAAAKLGPIGLGGALLGCALGLAFMLPGHLFGATGAGDVKLFAAAGALLGPATTVQAFLYTASWAECSQWPSPYAAAAWVTRLARRRVWFLRVALPPLKSSHRRRTTASRMRRPLRSVSSWRPCCHDGKQSAHSA